MRPAAHPWPVLWWEMGKVGSLGSEAAASGGGHGGSFAESSDVQVLACCLGREGGEVARGEALVGRELVCSCSLPRSKHRLHRSRPLRLSVGHLGLCVRCGG